MSYKTLRNSLTDSVRTYGPDESFGVKDRFGRELGASVTLFTAINTPVSWETNFEPFAQEVAKALLPAGRVYGFTPWSKRDGKPYGASQLARWFATEAQRDAAVVKYLAEARKRAAKNAGR